MEPLAIYREQRFEGKRVFELYPDRVAVRGSIQLQSDFETSIPLNSLNPQFMRLRVRNKSFWGGLWLLLGATIIDSVLISAFHIQPDTFAVGLVGSVGMAGLILMLATIRKVEFLSFTNIVGAHVLDFARSGPDASKLDEFVLLVSKQIAKATKGNAEPVTPPNSPPAPTRG